MAAKTTVAGINGRWAATRPLLVGGAVGWIGILLTKESPSQFLFGWSSALSFAAVLTWITEGARRSPETGGTG